ncbi:MAG: hypothetical protein J5824_04125 [Lachnospiraceae bacterium]|nr:hypothetical protein [Lachnospiraceae bacterium]
MKADILIDALGDIRDDFILDADSNAAGNRTADDSRAAYSNADDSRAAYSNADDSIADDDTAAYSDDDNIAEDNISAYSDADDSTAHNSTAHNSSADKNASHKNLIAKRSWIKYTAVAACLCVVIAAGILISQKIGKPTPVTLQWSDSMTARDYFTNSSNKKNTGDRSSASLVMLPYAVFVPIDSMRGELENRGVLPVVDDHPEQDFYVTFNGDGSLYKVSFMWMRRGENVREEYSDLTFTAAPHELHEISDTVYVKTDSDGNVIPPYVTTTVRDGITIYAEGEENENKTVTWQTDQGWYRISGSWLDSYEAVIELLDWFWVHPFDITEFADLAGEVFIYSDRTEYPDAFADRIPDFGALGYTAESERVNLHKEDGKLAPVWFDGIYTRGDIRIRWTINTGADAVAWAKCMGRLSEITEEKLSDALSGADRVNIFFDMPCMATLTIEKGTPEDAWEIIRSFPK